MINGWQPNPHAEELAGIVTTSRSLNAEAGDLVQLSKACIVPRYREGKKGEPYKYMIEYFTNPSSPQQEFQVLSCSGAIAYRDCIVRIIEKAHTIPHPCYQFPCVIKKENPYEK